MNKTAYQNFIMWKASNPKDKKPLTLSAYIQQNNLTIEDVESFMNSDSYTQDLLRATRFMLQTDLPDLMWSVYEQVKTKRKAQDLEALMKLLNPKDKDDASNNIFTDFDSELPDDQKEQILKRLYGKGDSK